MVIEDGTLTFTGPSDAKQGSGGQFSLDNAARAWTTLRATLWSIGVRPMAQRSSSRRARVSLRLGKGSLPGDLISNPHFHEMVMGWPIGWTAPGAPVTEFAAWLRRSRGALSALLADREVPAG
ncbi:hypothetical protein [Brevundimonas sp. A19_0]|uniref:hypothetical protein n=1 Tax=Brevundimonas sp. A19_0 TaxID=2821087 RepID=UPI001FD816D0|nr:hypothetical protein [Brevundimonas sp. A19_0]